VDVAETTVSFGGLYGHIDTAAQRAPGDTSPRFPTRPPSGIAEDLPGSVTHDAGFYRILPQNLDLNDPLVGQFIRGIAKIRLATTQIDSIDAEHVHVRSRSGLPGLGDGIAAAREARQALRIAEQELNEVFEAALAAVRQNRTDAEQLQYLGALREHLEGWIRDSEAQTASYGRRMENTVADLRQANTQLWRENRALRTELQRRDAEQARRTMTIRSVEYGGGEYTGYH
jgi:hypothetical protein